MVTWAKYMRIMAKQVPQKKDRKSLESTWVSSIFRVYMRFEKIKTMYTAGTIKYWYREGMEKWPPMSQFRTQTERMEAKTRAM